MQVERAFAASPSLAVVCGMSAPVTTALTPGIAAAAGGVDRHDARVRVRAAQDRAVQHARQREVGAVVARPVTLSTPSWRIGRVPT